MLIDSITLLSGSEIHNARVQTGTSFPLSPLQGQLYYLTAAGGGNDVGLYVYDGTAWRTGDISKIIAGPGLLGGGNSGEVTLSIDTNNFPEPPGLAEHSSNQSLHLTPEQNTLLDGLASTLTSMELNFADGVVASVQTQIDSKQAYSSELTAIAAVSGTSGILKKTNTNTWVLDTNDYITNLTLTGDVTSTGTSPVTVTLNNTGVTAGTYKSVTVDSKGRVTAGTNPTTLASMGITDGVKNAGASSSIQAGEINNRPTASTLGRYYVSTDTNSIFYDTGSTWNLLTPAYYGDVVISMGSTTTELSPTGVVAGTYNTVMVDEKGRVTAGTFNTGSTSGVSGGQANEIVYQTAPDETDFIATANNGVLVTNGSGVPSISTSLPNSFMIDGGSF